MEILRVPGSSIPACLAAQMCPAVMPWVSGTSLVSLGAVLRVDTRGYYKFMSGGRMMVFFQFSLSGEVFPARDTSSSSSFVYVEKAYGGIAFLLIPVTLYCASSVASGFKSFFHISVRDKSSVAVKRNPSLFTFLDGKGRRHIIMLNILWKASIICWSQRLSGSFLASDGLARVLMTRF